MLKLAVMTSTAIDDVVVSLFILKQTARINVGMSGNYIYNNLPVILSHMTFKVKAK